jgi:hypothetical protein
MQKKENVYVSLISNDNYVFYLDIRVAELSDYIRKKLDGIKI